MNSITFQVYYSFIDTLSVIASVILLLLIWKQGKTQAFHTKILENQNIQIETESKITKSLFYISKFNSLEFQKSVITKISDTFDFVKIKRDRNTMKDNPSQFTIDEVKELINSDIDFYHANLALINFFQELGNLYNRELVDRDLINSSLGRMSIVWYRKFLPTIESDRIGENDKTDWKKMNEFISDYLKEDFIDRTSGLVVNKDSESQKSD